MSNNSNQGPASAGNLITRPFAGYDSWDDVLGGIGDLAKTVGSVYNQANGAPQTANPPPPAKPPAWKSPAIIAAAALAVVAILFFALRRK